MPDQRFESPITLVWSQKGSSPLRFPTTPPIRAAGVKSARPTVVVVETLTSSGAVRVYYEQANDPDDEDDWGSATSLSTAWITGTGRTYTSSFTDISANLTRRFVRFGAEAKNDSGSEVELAQLGMVVDVRTE